ncbi:MAG: phosphopyruvate hydratase [Gammaproteobacteria bacterium AqS3]|nr:phosphopyruvate hydratase [Gammaproteobacteria bacterium AqS3]
MSDSLRIADVRALEVLDSRGNPTVYAEVELSGGAGGAAFVPSGASTGAREAVELRDGDAARYLGRGVLTAVRSIERELREDVLGRPADDQRALDAAMCELDGSENKSRLGANAILAVSLAAARAAAQGRGMPLHEHLRALYSSQGGQAKPLLPLPMMNILNGGAHADNNVDIQEFMVMPWGFGSFAESLRAGSEIFHHLKGLLNEGGFATGVGDEGGFAPDLDSNAQALDLVHQAIDRSGHADAVSLALDCAASEFHSDGVYRVDGASLSASDWFGQLGEMADAYPIASIEDGVPEDEWEHWGELTRTLGRRVQLVGDDVFSTNPEIFAKGIDAGIGNAILVKLNQIGTLSETIETVVMAQKAGYGVVISHRSGDTEDTTIADLCVACGAGQIKTGSLSRSERTAKYNRLLMIERASSGALDFAGRSAVVQTA